MFQHDGAWGPNMATVYSDRGHGVRAPIVFYNRSNEAAAQLKPGDFDWNAIFGSGVRWFHSGGIFASLSETAAELIIEGMKAAKAHGAVVSFDLNYREKLWGASGGSKRAVAVLGRIVEHVDVLVGNEEDLQKGLGIGGPEVTAKSALDPTTFIGMIERVVERYPQMKVVATTLREVHSTNRHSWGAVAWINGEAYVAPTCEIDVYDRVGGGDGFAAGLIYGLMSGETPGRLGAAWMGPRRARRDIPGRHDHGHARAGACVRRAARRSSGNGLDLRQRWYSEAEVQRLTADNCQPSLSDLRYLNRKAKMSASSSIIFETGLPAPWPAWVSTRMSTGRIVRIGGLESCRKFLRHAGRDPIVRVRRRNQDWWIRDAVPDPVQRGVLGRDTGTASDRLTIRIRTPRTGRR